MNTKKEKRRKCYFTELDDQFNPKEDIVLGPWCLSTLKEAEDLNIIEPYISNESLPFHRKLFDLGFFLLNRDLEEKHSASKEKYFLILQESYMYFVFFIFSRYRILKKTLDKYPIDNIIFEHVDKPQQQFFSFMHLTPQFSGYIAYKILECLVEKKKISVFYNTNKRPPQVIETDKKEKFYLCLKKYLNYFSHVNGVKFVPGFFLSFLYRIVNLNRKLNYSPLPYNPIIDFDEEFLQFIEIFDSISNLFHNQSIDFYPEMKVPKFFLKNPSFIYYPKENLSITTSCIKNVSKIIVLQHGACYATFKKHLPRELEYSFSNFLSWGSKSKSYLNRSNVINHLPSPYLSSISNSYVFEDQTNILWVTGIHYKGGDGLEYIYGTEVLKYIKKKINFYNTLQHQLKEKIFYKMLPPSPVEFYDEMKNILDPKKYTYKGKAVDLMLNSKVVFIDYYGTPFYEAMSMNAPTVLGLFESDPFFTEEAAKIFQRFEDAGVVYRTPKSAAQFLNQLYDSDIQKWWHGEEIQRIRKDFLKMYANNKRYFWPWVKAILRKEI